MRKANTGVIVYASNNRLSFLFASLLAVQRLSRGIGSKDSVWERFSFDRGDD
jgi:hypothetical protein